MDGERGVHPDCRNASNPYHECVDYCFRKIAEAKARSAETNSGTQSTRSVRMSVRELVEKKKKSTREGMFESEVPPTTPKRKKDAMAASIAVTPAVFNTGKVIIEVPEDFGSDSSSQWSLLQKFHLPKTREQRGSLKLNEMAETLSQNAFKLLQDCLSTVEKVSSYEKSINTLWCDFEESMKEKDVAVKRCEELEKEIAALKKENDQLKMTNVDAKVEVSKALAEKAEQECEVAKLKSEMEELATYYGLKARVELMEDYIMGKCAEWDLEGEKMLLEDFYKDGAPSDHHKAGKDIAEVLSTERIVKVEGSDQSPWQSH